jgi:flagellar hook-basal body complex protein FliE
MPGGDGTNCGPEAFKNVLAESLDKVNEAQREASTAAEDLVTGKRTDIEGVMLATQKADTAFRMLLALRNKVQAAYDEIKQVRV